MIASQAVISGADYLIRQAIQLACCSANLLKIKHGGWFPVALGVFIDILMTTWKRGRAVLGARLAENYMSPDDLVTQVAPEVPTIPGNGVFLTQNTSNVPHALLHSLKHFKRFYERVVIVTVEVAEEPHVADEERLKVDVLSPQFYRVRVSFGFMDEPDLPLALEKCAALGLELDPMETSFVLGREIIVPRRNPGMALWRQMLFVAMGCNAGSASAYLRLPPNRVVELGTPVVL